MDTKLPDVNLIPNPAYLVIGSYPGENPKGRDFYDNPAYYLYDMMDIDEGINRSRYIQSEFNNSSNKDISKVYFEKFDVVIFDYNVSKSIENIKDVIEDLFNMVKKDGILIIDDSFIPAIIPPGTTSKEISEIISQPYRMRELREQSLLMKVNKMQQYMGAYLVEPILYPDIIKENIVAASVYGSKLDDYDRKNRKCIIIRKSILTFGGKRKVKRLTKKSRGYKTKKRHYRKKSN